MGRKTRNIKERDASEFYTSQASAGLSVEEAAKVSEKRGKRALWLFLALALAGGIAIMAYFVTGRGWTVAATIVDENIGNMNNYTVVVFNGTRTRPLEDADVSAAIYHEGRNEVSDLSEGLIPVDENGEISYSNLGDRIMSVFHRAMAKFQTEDQSKVYPSDVRDLYEISGADVFSISLSDHARYSPNRIYNLQNRTIGVFSIQKYTSRAAISRLTDGLRSRGADTVICLAKNETLLSDTEGIDILLLSKKSTDDADLEDSETLVVEAPYDDEVGIILISSNGVPYYKSISEL